MALSVFGTAGAWAPAQNVSVANGAGGWLQAKSVKRTDGLGNWTVVWVPPTDVTVTGPASSLSLQAGTNGVIPPTIAPSVLTVTLDNPESAGVVVLQQSSDAGATWANIMVWNAPLAATMDYSHTFGVAGVWQVRAAVTLLDGRVVHSNVHMVTCYTKNLTATTSNPTPDIFDPFTITASCGAACEPAATGGTWFYRFPGIDPTWIPYGSHTTPGAHPSSMVVWQELVQTYEWTYQETFADGSIIYSSSVLVEPVIISHFHEVVPAGQSIQWALDRATTFFRMYQSVPVNFDDELSMACVELTAGATYNIWTTPLNYRQGVRLQGNGATILGTGSHIFKGDNNGGGGYLAPNRDWQIINTKLDCGNLSGGISTAHVHRYRLDTVEIKNIGGGKHHLEINSSGGPVEAGFNVEVINCYFHQTLKSSGVRTEDEAIQLDYSWDGAAPDVADDGTVTNNVLIRGCTFDQVPRAIGGHVYNSKPTIAAGIHSHVLIEGCTLSNVNPMVWGDGAPNSPSSEGAVRVYYWNDVVIQDNVFNTCYQPVMVYSPNDSVGAAYDMGQTSIFRNIFNNCGGANGRHCAYGSAGGSGKSIGQVYFQDNRLRGTWGGGPDGYFAGFDNTSGLLPNSAYGVVIRGNWFEPSNYDLVGEADYNKYRTENSSNLTGVYIAGNFLSDGSVDNS